jgi:oligopeptide/dipeptide ABC transporter ATP-binding protein
VFFDSVGDVLTVFGVYDEFAKYIEQELNVLLSTRDNNIEIRGENDACQVAHAVIQELLRRAKKEENILTGDVPSPLNPPTGCRFHPRCASCMEICKEKEPKLREIPGKPGHFCACHLLNNQE